jgi:hypothetical protein
MAYASDMHAHVDFGIAIRYLLKWKNKLAQKLMGDCQIDGHFHITF